MDATIPSGRCLRDQELITAAKGSFLNERGIDICIPDWPGQCFAYGVQDLPPGAWYC